MPKKGQRDATGLTYAEAIEEFGEAAVHSLGRPDNLKARGVTAHGLVKLMRSRQAHTVQSAHPRLPLLLPSEDDMRELGPSWLVSCTTGKAVGESSGRQSSGSWNP